jgi:hypothetical protein|nr:MAG TPA: hypothetical protein [Caudoviricetes sp.]
MLRKEVEYKDFDGNDRKDVLWFHLNEVEITEMDLETSGGLVKYMESIIDTNDVNQLITIFKDLLIRSYGERSMDGKHFYKDDKIRNEFVSSAAYPVLYMEMVSDADKAVEFINGIVPSNIREQMAKIENTPEGAAMLSVVK